MQDLLNKAKNFLNQKNRTLILQIQKTVENLASSSSYHHKSFLNLAKQFSEIFSQTESLVLDNPIHNNPDTNLPRLGFYLSVLVVSAVAIIGFIFIITNQKKKSQLS